MLAQSLNNNTVIFNNYDATGLAAIAVRIWWSSLAMVGSSEEYSPVCNNISLSSIHLVMSASVVLLTGCPGDDSSFLLLICCCNLIVTNNNCCCHDNHTHLSVSLLNFSNSSDNTYSDTLSSDKTYSELWFGFWTRGKCHARSNPESGPFQIHAHSLFTQSLIN